MGLVYRRRKRIGRRTHANASATGASISQRYGRVTVNSRGRGSVRLARGFSWRFRWWGT